MKPRSAGHLHVEAVEKPLFAAKSVTKKRGIVRAFFIRISEFHCYFRLACSGFVEAERPLPTLAAYCPYP